jgi:hypothetical protein
MKLAGKTVEWLYSTDCAIRPFRWSGIACCPRNEDYADFLSHQTRSRKEAEIDYRLTSQLSLKLANNDSMDEATNGDAIEASKDGDACIASELAKSDCSSREEKGSTKEPTPLSVPLEMTAAATVRIQDPDWHEEKKHWISAAGVQTPADLERKLAEMYRVAAQNEAAVKKLTGHVTEVRTFLRQLHEMDEHIVKRKRRSDRTSPRRKRSRADCVFIESQDSSSEGMTEQKARSLLDPQIMSSFGNLINSPA